MLTFFLLMILPTAVAVFAVLRFKRQVTLPEFGILLAVPALIAAIGLAIVYHCNTTDYEVWNGRVTGKDSRHVSCSHSYPCRCRPVSSGIGKNRTTTIHCDTCYEHFYDVSWYVYANTGESITIDRVDRQGLAMPPRWGAAFVGESFASRHRYTNYLLANRSSVLFGGKGDVERFKTLIPDYPADVHDYYHVHHVVNMGVPVNDLHSWNWLMDQINGDLGPSKQVNALLLFVKTDDPNYVLALKDAWAGGKKNGSTIVIGSLDGHKIAFVDVVSWTPAQHYKVELRDRIMEIGTLDKRDDIARAIREETQSKFTRMHMKDYEYLMRTIEPSSTAVMVMFFLCLCVSVGLAIYMVKNGVDDDAGYGSRLKSFSWRWHSDTIFRRRQGWRR